MPDSNPLSHIPRYALVLGLLTAIGPFAVDMYLPALPLMGRQLNASPLAMQLSLTFFFLAMGLGQLAAGPLSDIFGRKRPIAFGLALFIGASIGCALAPNLPTLIALRFVQGIGACACTVTPRAVVRDLYAGADAARLMSLLLTVYTVSPILAPLVGSFITEALGWRAVFVTVGLLALLCGLLIRLWLPETRPAGKRSPATLLGAMRGYALLLRDAHFMGAALIASLTVAGFFVFVANSPFLYSAHYGVSSHHYAMLFGMNALPLVLLSQWNGKLAARFGLRRVLGVAVTAHMLTLCLLTALLLGGLDSLPLLAGLLLATFGLNGVIVPLSFVLAMENHPELAGSASALIGTLNYIGGALAVALVAPFADGQPLPMVAGIATCSILGFALSLRLLGAARGKPQAGLATPSPRRL